MAVNRSYPSSEVRDSGKEELPHVQGVVAARVQEGREEVRKGSRFREVQGQEGWL